MVMATVSAGCGDTPTQTLPSTSHVVDSPECEEFTNQIGVLMDRGIAEDHAAETRQTNEYNNLESNLAASSESEERKTIATNNLTTRQDAENEARETRQENQILAVQERSRSAGCIAPNK
jgi:hypothetical protein